MATDGDRLTLKLRLDGAVLRLYRDAACAEEADGQGYRPRTVKLHDWEWREDGCRAKLEHTFWFEDGDQTLMAWALVRENPYGEGEVVLQHGLIDGAPCRVRVKGSRVDVEVSEGIDG